MVYPSHLALGSSGTMASPDRISFGGSVQMFAALQKVEQLREASELPRYEHQAHHDHEHPAGEIQHTDATRERTRDTLCAPDTRSDQEKGDAHAERVRREKRRARGDVLAQQQVEDHRQIRSDARRHPDAEGGADEE